MKRVRASRGFTLVELLIVIVVIAILAAITIVAYGGVTSRAQQSAVESDLSQGVKALEAANVQSGSYPTSLTSTSIKPSGSGSFSYQNFPATNGYCLSEANGAYTYFVTSNSQTPIVGSCDSLDVWLPLGSSNGDQSGNGVAVAQNTATTGPGENGQSDGASVFDGTSNDLYTINDQPSLDPTAGVTVTAWINAVAFSSTMQEGIVSKDIQTGVNNPPYAIYANTSGSSWIGIITTAANSSPSTTCSTGLATGTWYFLAMTDSGTTLTDYQNGNVCGTTATSALPAATTGALRIGQQKTGMGRYFNGSIDDVRVWGRALSADEITALYKAGAT